MNIPTFFIRLKHAHKNYGTRGLFLLLTKIMLKNFQKKKKNINIGDILFITGTHLDHPRRYRVLHQIEQLKSQNIHADNVFYKDLTNAYLNRYSGFIFYRTPITNQIENFIKKAKELNKTIFFDIDDLVFDKKYVNLIEHVQKISESERRLYLSTVENISKTIKLCDYAIVSTQTIKNVLKEFVNIKDILVNKNVASEELFYISEQAYKQTKKTSDKIRIGYFSGSITHNADFGLIKDVLLQILSKYKNVTLVLCGFLSIPEDFKDYKEQIEIQPFVNWKKLPQIIASVDINLVPLQDTIFNQAKSANKWLEAALVRVPSIASNVGTLSETIRNQMDGILVENTNESWIKNIEDLINNKNKRNLIAQNAYNRVKKEFVTTYTSATIRDFITSKLKKRIAFIVPDLRYNGGIRVILKHAEILQKEGNDVVLINTFSASKNIDSFENIPVINLADIKNISGSFDVVVATLWRTVDLALRIKNKGKIKYLVQNYETDFYEIGNITDRLNANSTYSLEKRGVEYLTVSKWCLNWLDTVFNVKNIKYIPNGIDTNEFLQVTRDVKDRYKIRILIEGSQNHYKNVDESFEIVKNLDPSLFEIWYVSYFSKPKSWYRYDRFFSQVPFNKMPNIYKECDILLKSSILESFSYPPLEMMATGGLAVVRLNDGNKEYINNDVAFVYEKPEEAIHFLQSLKSRKDLLDVISSKKDKIKKLVQSRDWENIKDIIIEAYQ